MSFAQPIHPLNRVIWLKVECTAVRNIYNKKCYQICSSQAWADKIEDVLSLRQYWQFGSKVSRYITDKRKEKGCPTPIWMAKGGPKICRAWIHKIWVPELKDAQVHLWEMRLKLDWRKMRGHSPRCHVVSSAPKCTWNLPSASFDNLLMLTCLRMDILRASASRRPLMRGNTKVLCWPMEELHDAKLMHEIMLNANIG